MNIEEFINLVHGHRCLWDQSDSSYHLRDYQRRSWREISEEMKLPEDKLKKKWRGLRDTFGRELKKVTKKKLGQATDSEPNSKWPYFTILMFLKGTISRRDLKSNTSETYEGMVSDGECGINTSAGSDYPPSPAVLFPQNYEQTSMETFKSPLKKKVYRQKPDEIDAKLLQIEEKKLKYFEENANDPDTQFLMSLLPFLKDVPKHRKLIVRAKLQQVFLDEQNGISSSVQFDYSSDSSQYNSIPEHISTQGQSQQSTSVLQQQQRRRRNLSSELKRDPSQRLAVPITFTMIVSRADIGEAFFKELKCDLHRPSLCSV